MQLKKKQCRVAFENEVDKEGRKKYGEKHGENDFDQNEMNLFHYCIWNNHYSTAIKLAECGYGNVLQIALQIQLSQNYWS